jgi:trk system potassium uptake protein TrkA
MKIVIMGCGRVGILLAKILDSEGHKVAVIDRDSLAFDDLCEDFQGHMITGNGIDADVQREAGTADADAFVTATRDDNTNIMAAQVAKEIFGVPRVVARIYDSEREHIFHELGLKTICPVTVGAFQIRNAILADTLRRTPLETTNNLELIEAALPEDLDGKKVRDIPSPGEVRVVALEREGLSMIPNGDTSLKSGDTITIVISRDVMPRLQALLGIKA